jgi:hypothetical protein
MAGLDRTRMYRANGDLMHAVAGNRHKLICIHLGSMRGIDIEGFAQRMHIARPGSMAQPLAVVAALHRVQSQHVGDAALHAVCRREQVAEIGEGRLVVIYRQREHQQTGSSHQSDLQRIERIADRALGTGRDLAAVLSPQRKKFSAAVQYLFA